MAGHVAKPRTKQAAKDQAAKAKSRRKLIHFGVAFVVLVTTIWAMVFLLGPGPNSDTGETRYFMVEDGDVMSRIGGRLKEEGLVNSAVGFRLAVLLSGTSGTLKTGEYEIPSRATPGQIVKILIRGEGVKRMIVFPEGWSVNQIYTRLNANPYLTGELPPPPPEGSLNPSTYPFQRGDSRASLVKQMQASHKTLLDALWLQRAPDLPFNNKNEALILASIVEKETGLTEERPRVAAVFVNRLRAGMKLQSDPTIIYGITKGAPLGRKIFKSDLENPHAWNTYVISGLPPTPIANPGKDAIKAVLNPPKTRELFFVADGTGGHAFAETYGEHQKNVARWRAWRAYQESNKAITQGGK
ncbi:endolytic transglycosylase MltG [Candidatus Phycosocius spiralis]|uniref:Endolytic murein transglycosylase n=1 Tax=Candidatus Phycosocius spiralis TaxID=2815099 RepID=A0ABQ4PW81_9PROT|nr:endolytic transglycosylase MltG [Candidatus Phycosocius spiralis]GIU67257.1 aminodeoxychorismate lyase [Candidatus Phycosocius spiralis]